MIREIEKISKQQTISIPVKADKDGCIDKECPVEDCCFGFKVNETDWANLFKDEAVYCPQCGHVAPSKSWWTKEQIKEAKKQAFNFVKYQVGNALSLGAKDFNRQPQNGFITFKLKVNGVQSRYVILPIEAQEAMEQKIVCNQCNARFSVIGAAFFCPCCGHNSVERMFDQTLEKVVSKLNITDKFKAVLDDSGQKDEAVITCQSIIETCLSDCVTAFQFFCEKKYQTPVGEKKISSQSFQRIDFGSSAWKKVLGQGYEDWITKEECSELNILFQRRHLLQHCNGIVDEKYLEKTGDQKYRLGQRIVVSKNDVEKLLFIIKMLASNIRLMTGTSSLT